MSKINYATSSPYGVTPQYSWRIGRYVHRRIGPDSTDKIQTITMTYQFRPDKLSFDLYRTPTYYWVFMVRNMDQIRDPIWDLVSGMTIMVPTLGRLQSLGF